MKQAIVTKYLAPTNTKPARVKATASLARPSVTIPWDSAWSVEYNHTFAAQLLKVKLGWSGTLQAGSISAHSVAHVFID